jgi:hypothetical protein
MFYVNHTSDVLEPVNILKFGEVRTCEDAGCTVCSPVTLSSFGPSVFFGTLFLKHVSGNITYKT